MGIKDIVLMGLIIAGALYLLYRSLWRKKGHCAGCDACETVKKGCNEYEKKQH